MSFSNICFTSFEDEPPHWNADKLVYLVFQRERSPTTGKLHYQGYAEFIRSTRVREIQNILAIGSGHVERRSGNQQQAIDYCKKEDSRVEPPVEFGQPKAAAEAEGKRKRLDDTFGRALEAGTPELALEIIRREAPTDYCKGFNSIKAAIDHKFGKKRAIYTKRLEFGWRLPDEIQQWLEQEFPKGERAKTLIVVGTTRLGKTAWARSLGHHMFWRGNVAYGDWDDSARYIVIDDIPWQFIPQKKSILTQMGEVTLTDKYVKKLTVNNNKPAIVLSNDFPDFGAEAGYWQANSILIEVTDSLFDTTQRAIEI